MLPIEPTKSSLRGEKKEVPFAQSECGKKNQRVCTQAHTLVSIESDHQCVTAAVDPRSSLATINNKLNKNNSFV